MFTRDYLLSIKTRKPAIDRLLSKTKQCENGCIEYTGGKDRCGYGSFKIGKHCIGAHKVAYLLLVGDFDQTKELMHTCDNPACINTDHLIPVTHKENMYDCISKGRHTYQNNFHSFICSDVSGDSSRFLLSKNEGLVIDVFSSRKLAIQLGFDRYVGSPCEKHLIGIRKTNNGSCIYCAHEYKTDKTNLRKSLRKSAETGN